MKKGKGTGLLIDESTGEVLKENINIIAIGKPKGLTDRNFLKVFPAFFFSFLEELKIEDGRARMIIYLMFKAIELPMDGDNVVLAPNDELMEKLGMCKGSVLKYINVLIDAKIIKRVQPRMPLYKINKEMIYKGTLSKAWKRELEEKTRQESK
jgi:hypothetical protein